MSKTRKSPKTPTARPGIEIPVLGLFFLSGASALIYEVVWGRVLTFIFGGTAFAIATVLAAYMAGLALGSWVFGRRIDRAGHPLKVYGLLEAGIAAWALILPLVLSGLNAFYGVVYRGLHPGPYALSLIRFVLSFLVLLVPTILMGGTLPVLSKLLVSSRETVGLKTGLLYGTNTVGAVAGTAAAGFFLIPAFGMTASTWIAIAFNAIVALIALGLTRSIPWKPPIDEPAVADSPPATRSAAVDSLPPTGPAVADGPPATSSGAADSLPATRPAAIPHLKGRVLFVYAASGFAALAYEVAWTKVLSGALGTTTYAFSAMLTTFLLGLALGAFVMARLADRYDPGRLLAWSQLVIAVLGLAALPLFGNLPVYFIEIFKAWGPSWNAQAFARFLFCAVTMLPPTFLMGGTFPLVARIYADRTGRMGEQVGRLYASNTLGAILGSFSAGFILIPLIGRQGTILAAVAVNVISAAVLYQALWPTLPLRPRLAALIPAILLLPLAWLGGRPWDKHILTSGAYVYAQTLANEPDLHKAMHDQRILFYKEETDATVAVMAVQHVVSVRINGKVDASSSGDMVTQKLVAHLPILVHPDAKDVMVLGLASGISMGSVLSHPEVKKADCIETLKSMRRVTDFFRPYNHNATDDPRFHLIINDGRNHLQLTKQTYDVIISQPSNPWIVGTGSLFTHEYFDLGRRHLNSGGIFCQWIQTYQMSHDDFGSALKTFHEVFPYVTIWMGAPGDMIVLGSEKPMVFDWAALSRDLSQPDVARDLDTIGIEDPAAFLQAYVGHDRAVSGLITPSSRTVTDDNLLLEFSMPRNIYGSNLPMMDLLRIRSVREPYAPIVNLASLPPDSAARVTRRLTDYYEARQIGLEGIDWSVGKEFATAIPILEKALALAPTDHLVGHFLARSLNEVGIKLLLGGQTSQAMKQFEEAARVGSPEERALALNNIGLQHYQEGRVDSAGVYWQQAADIEPESPIIRFNLALVYDTLNKKDLAEREYRATLETDPENAVALNNLAWILCEKGSAGEAASLAEKAVKIERSSGNLDTWGWSLWRGGRAREAEKVLRESVKVSDDNMEAQFHLAQVLIDKGQRDEARTILTRVAAAASSQGDLARRARESLERL